AHEAFFAGEEIYNNFTLERLTIQQDPSLSDREKGLAIEALRENLPEEMQQLLVPQIHNDLREQTLALRAAGADEGRIRQLRMGMLGPEATERLEELDRSRAEWRERVEAFQQERERILSQPGLAESDRRAAVNALLEEQFTANERLRLINGGSLLHPHAVEHDVLARGRLLQRLLAGHGLHIPQLDVVLPGQALVLLAPGLVDLPGNLLCIATRADHTQIAIRLLPQQPCRLGRRQS